MSGASQGSGTEVFLPSVSGISVEVGKAASLFYCRFWQIKRWRLCVCIYVHTHIHMETHAHTLCSSVTKSSLTL